MEPRRRDLVSYPGRFVALAMDTDEVVADAPTFAELVALLKQRGITSVSIMRAPWYGEPIHVGAG